jgi:hypothetical protein
MWLCHQVSEQSRLRHLRPSKGNLCHIGCELTPLFTGGTPHTLLGLPFTFAQQTCDAKAEETNKLAIKNMRLVCNEVVGNPEGVR